MAQGEAVISLPTVESLDALQGELEGAGFAPVFRSALHRDLQDHLPAFLKDLRQRLGLSQEEFALQFGLEKRTVEGWEYGKPADRISRTFLLMIDRDPVTTRRLVNAG